MRKAENVNMNLIYEAVTEQHIPELQSIYNYYVLNTTYTFNTEPLTGPEMKNLLLNFNSSSYSSHVIYGEAGLLGYIYIGPYKTRQAYHKTGEITIYLKPDASGQGVGKQALHFIEEIAIERGFHTLLAGLCSENGKSRGLFERCGYVKCAHFKEVGLKFGRFLDIEYYQKQLG